MGRRSRKRRTAAVLAPLRPTTNAPAAAPARRAPMAEAPKAPWSPFPLVESCIVLAIALIVAGALMDGGRRTALLAGGIGLASLAGLELSLREHLCGFRSHSALLAGAAAVLAVVPLFFLTGLPQVALLAVGAAVYTLAFFGLRAAFRARSSGMGFRA